MPLTKPQLAFLQYIASGRENAPLPIPEDEAERTLALFLMVGYISDVGNELTPLGQSVLDAEAARVYAIATEGEK